MGHIEDLKVKVKYLDIMENQEYLQALIDKTGRRTVPCLFIDGSPMFESDLIMEWLDSNQQNLEKE